MTSDSTQMNNDSKSVTAHNGMDSNSPTPSMTDTISSGNVVADMAVSPEAPMMVVTIPCATLNRAVISSIPWEAAACANTKRIKVLNTTSGRFISVKLPQVLTTPITKNNTRSA